MVTRNDETNNQTGIDSATVDVEGQLFKPETLQRGFFQLIINHPDDAPIIKLDTSLLPERIQQLLKQAPSILQDARETIVDSHEMYEAASLLRKQSNGSDKELEEARVDITGRIDDLKEIVMVEFRGDKTLKDGPVHQYKTATKILDEKLVAYELEE